METTRAITLSGQFERLMLGRYAMFTSRVKR
jgi:hypothetical protein